jgi:hypothetical protein
VSSQDRPNIAAQLAVPASSMPTTQPIEPVKYPRRVTLPLTEDDYRFLMALKLADRVDIAMRLRATLRLMRENTTFAHRVNTLARHMLDEQRAR